MSLSTDQLSDIGAAQIMRLQQRLVWIDVARGLGIIFVVYGHMLRGLVSSGLFPAGPEAGWMDYTLYTFHMPLFFLLSGLNVQQSLQRGRQTFLWARLTTIAYPYVLWSLIVGGLSIFAGSAANNPITLADFTAIWYHPIAQFWFLYALALCHILAVLVTDRRVLALLALTGFSIFEFLPPGLNLALTLHDLPFYVIGVHMAARPSLPARQAAIYLVPVTLLFIVSAAAGGVASSMNPFAITSVPACFAGIAATILFSMAVSGSVFSVMGAMSMTIYVLHTVFGAGARIIFARYLTIPEPWTLLLICTTTGVVGPMLFHVAARRAGLLPWFGLATWRPAPASGIRTCHPD